MMDYAPLRDSARRARQQHTAAAYEASLRQALNYAPVPTGPAGAGPPASAALQLGPTQTPSPPLSIHKQFTQASSQTF